MLKQKSARQISRTGPKDHYRNAVGHEIDYLRRLLHHQMLKNRLFSLLKLALAELPLKKWFPRSKIRIWKIFGEIPKNMFEVCLESFETQRTLRNHFQTFFKFEFSTLEATFSKGAQPKLASAIKISDFWASGDVIIFLSNQFRVSLR